MTTELISHIDRVEVLLAAVRAMTDAQADRLYAAWSAAWDEEGFHSRWGGMWHAMKATTGGSGRDKTVCVALSMAYSALDARWTELPEDQRDVAARAALVDVVGCAAEMLVILDLVGRDILTREHVDIIVDLVRHATPDSVHLFEPIATEDTAKEPHS
jgi:hypothetical protein